MRLTNQEQGNLRFQVPPNLEWQDWVLYYTPPSSVGFDDLIVNVGARDGDSAKFFIDLGYRNLRLVEPNSYHWDDLKHNVEIWRSMGITIDLRLEPFKKEHLDGAKFAEIDCEGCEWEIGDFYALPFPCVIELHGKHPPDAQGIYSYLHEVYGYLVWRPYGCRP